MVHFQVHRMVHRMVHLFNLQPNTDMASIKQRKNTWYAVWYERGSQVVKSTNIKVGTAKDKKLAQSAADTMEQAAKGNITVAAALDALRKLSSTLGIGKKLPTIKEFFDNVEILGSESNRTNVKRSISLFLNHLGSDIHQPLDLLTGAQCRSFIEEQLKRVSIGTVRLYRSQLKTAIDTAVQDEIITRNPFDLVSLKRIAAKTNTSTLKRLPFTIDEIRTLIKRAPAPWKQIILLCILTGGQRIGDIVTMKWEQIDWKNGLILIRTKKTGRDIATPITDAVKRLLEPLYSPNNTFIFPDMAVRYSRSKGAPSAEFLSMLKAYGIVNESNIHTSVSNRKMSDKSFHSLRHSVVSMLRVNADFTTDLIRETVGHDSEEVERGYFTPSVEAKRSVINFLAEQITPTTQRSEGYFYAT